MLANPGRRVDAPAVQVRYVHVLMGKPYTCFIESATTNTLSNQIRMCLSSSMLSPHDHVLRSQPLRSQIPLIHLPRSQISTITLLEARLDVAEDLRRQARRLPVARRRVVTDIVHLRPLHMDRWRRHDLGPNRRGVHVCSGRALLLLLPTLVVALVLVVLVLVVALPLVALVLITLVLVRGAGRRSVLTLLLAVRLLILARWGLLVLARRGLRVSLPPLSRRRGRRVVLPLGLLVGELVALVVAVGGGRGGVVLSEAGGTGRLVASRVEGGASTCGGVAGADGADGAREAGVLMSAADGEVWPATRTCCSSSSSLRTT